MGTCSNFEPAAEENDKESKTNQNNIFIKIAVFTPFFLK